MQPTRRSAYGAAPRGKKSSADSTTDRRAESRVRWPMKWRNCAPSSPGALFSFLSCDHRSCGTARKHPSWSGSGAFAPQGKRPCASSSDLKKAFMPSDEIMNHATGEIRAA
eukprot:2754947-Prymnesium_polylepis.1